MSDASPNVTDVQLTDEEREALKKLHGAKALPASALATVAAILAANPGESPPPKQLTPSKQRVRELERLSHFGVDWIRLDGERFDRADTKRRRKKNRRVMKRLTSQFPKPHEVNRQPVKPAGMSKRKWLRRLGLLA